MRDERITMNFEQAIEKTLGHEGGFADNPNDRGGMTFMGISRRWFPDEPLWAKIDALLAEGRDPNEAIEELRPDVVDFYRREFWDKYGCETLPESIRHRHFDFTINGGAVSSVKVVQALGNVFCQEALGGQIDEDGLTGPATRRAIAALAALPDNMQAVLPIAYRSLQGVHFLNLYKEDRTQVEFIRGWLINRAS